MSPVSARTVRVTMPIGITEVVTAGRMRYFGCAPSPTPQALEPPGPAPTAGSQFNCTEKMITSTMPSQ